MATIEVPAHGGLTGLAADPKLLIGGSWVDAAEGETFPTENPATGEVHAHVPHAKATDVDRAVAAAREAFDEGSWRAMAPAQRSRILLRIADLLEEHIDELAELESLDNGKAVVAARAIDLPSAVEQFRYMAGWVGKLDGSAIELWAAPAGQYHAFTRREPVGVVAAIQPWNFPIGLTSWKLAPALAVGNTVVLKPAEQTPLSSLRLAEIMVEAGVPSGVINVVTGFGETTGAALAAHPQVDKVAFTGSTEVGKLILDAARGNLKRVSLELGGKSPNIIFADADLEAAIPAAAVAIFFNHGQACTAGSRLFVERSVHDQVAEGVAQIARALKVGPGSEPDTDIGPLISDEQRRRVLGYIDSGVQDGARLLTGEQQPDGPGHYVAPTVMVDARPEMKAVREEIFGPVVAVMPFDDEAAVVAEANASPYGLVGAVWTSDMARAHRVAGRLQAGTVWINCYDVFDPALPFGGYKQSGWGRENGRAVLDHYTEHKTVVAQV